MPSYDAQKRPSIPHRHSSASNSFAPPPADGLPSSVQRQKNIRFAVGPNRVGPRVPSHSRNLNKLSKLTSARPANNPSASPKQNVQVKRNMSSGQLAHNTSAAALRKNQSETSLKRNNRSSGQLTKLTHTASSRNVTKAQKRSNRADRSNSGSKALANHDAPVSPTVHFDIGTGGEDEDEPDLEGVTRREDEDGAWENYTDSRSPSTTRASTPRPHSTVVSPNKPDRKHPEGNDRPPDTTPDLSRQSSQTLAASASKSSSAASLSTLTPTIKQVAQHSAKPARVDNIASRLLRRNTSFNNAALPQVSSNSASPVLIGNHQHTSSGSSQQTLNDNNNNTEVVSRFLNSQSSSATPRNSIFLPSASNSPEKDWTAPQEDEGPRRNLSMPDFTEMRPSRTQQKLNLERESVAREPPHGGKPPISLLRGSRFASANVPFYELGTDAQDGRADLQLRRLFEQTATEYRRIKMFQDPMAAAIGRLQDAGAVPRKSISTRPKQGKRGGLLSGSGDGAYGLSQSWRSHRSNRSGDARDKHIPRHDQNGLARRPRVMFQGLENKDERISDGRQSLDGHQDPEEREARPQRDEAKDLCRRMWNRREGGGSED